MITKLSATVLTHNSADTIEKCLSSLKSITDEIVIIDDYSQDNTLEKISQIAPEAKIYQNKLDNDFARQRNFSLEKCQNEWVIIIDSDEELSEQLQNSITDVFEKKLYNKSRAFNCLRLNRNLAGWSEEKLNRPILMNKDLKWHSSIHEEVDEELYFIPGELYHHSWNGMKDYMDEINKYTTWKALSWVKQGRNYNLSYLCVRQTLNFLYLFFKKLFYEKRYKLGMIGYLYCLAWASEELFVGLKFYEMKKEEKRKIN